VTIPFVQTYTANDIILLALKNASLLGVGQTALDEDIDDVFNLMNGMLAQWSRRRWLIWHLLDLSVATTSQQSYSIGPGGDFNSLRPDRLEYAYFRQSVANANGPVDFPLTILQSMEDYAAIALKQLTTWPNAIFYDAALPLGLVYPVPVPNVANSELHILVKDTVNQFATRSTPFALPEEYYEAIWSNLALRVAATFPGANINPFTVGIAKASLATIRGANAQMPRLRMPTALVRPPLFNIFSGQTY
jgi:hypothetical protein